MDSEKQLQPTHNHPLTLVPGGGECYACSLHIRAKDCYHCSTCKIRVTFHKECITYSPDIIHPYHPIHPLQIWTKKFGEVVGSCFWCKNYMGYIFYRCPICNLNIHLFCASQQQLVLTLDPGKEHHHPLTIFPRRMDFTCNICGRFGDWYPIYACVQCDLLIHSHCLKLPRVIRISCHEHRISRRRYLPPGTWYCEVCYLDVDPRYGAFFCTQGCGYPVHTQCATLDHVWDGNELEDTPEDEDELKDVEPYEVVGEGLIKHFSHDHHLKFVLNLEGDITGRRCQACNLHIQFDSFYTCNSLCCDFILHEKCANFQRKRWHPRHPHRLTLKANNDMAVSINHSGRRGFYCCSMCTRFSCGFRYVCEKDNCHFEVDVRCAAIQRQIKHKSHVQKHPLMLCLINTSRLTCVNCQKASDFVLYCLQCTNYFMCFECATLPDKVAYKHDTHPLILCCGEEDEKEGQEWCETCEEKLDSKKWYYKCDDCKVTLHIQCSLGRSPYAKPGPIMIKAARPDEDHEVIEHKPPLGVLAESYIEFIPIRREEDFTVIGNNTLTRPFCCHCDHRCQDFVAFKQEQDFYCSLDCLKTKKLYHDSDIFPKYE